MTINMNLSRNAPPLALRLLFALALPCAGTAYSAAHAQSLNAKDIQIVGKALGFLDPAASSGVVAVVYDPASASSKQDADAIVAAFGGGVSGGSASFTAKSISTADLGDGSGYVAIIAASGGAGDQTIGAARAHKILCITGDKSVVSAGKCVMAVSSDPKVEIVVSTGAAQSTGVNFASAFRMLISEI